jgi:hypothetical protein
VRADSARDLRLSDSFDPTLPYAKLPLEEIKNFEKELDFGKIKVVDGQNSKKNKN